MFRDDQGVRRLHLPPQAPPPHHHRQQEVLQGRPAPRRHARLRRQPGVDQLLPVGRLRQQQRGQGGGAAGPHAGQEAQEEGREEAGHTHWPEVSLGDGIEKGM